MARNKTKPGLEKRERDRIFSSPVAISFVRIVVARRGITEAEARKLYLDYINRAQPHHRGTHSVA
jgi:hypothetical protein